MEDTVSSLNNKRVILRDWENGRIKLFSLGHNTNIFQAKPMPKNGEYPLLFVLLMSRLFVTFVKFIILITQYYIFLSKSDWGIFWTFRAEHPKTQDRP